MNTLIVSFLAFQFFTIIAEYKSEVIDSPFTIYGISKKKQDIAGPALPLKMGIRKTTLHLNRNSGNVFL